MSRSKFRSRFISVNGLRTHYLEAGEAGPVVVLLHSGEFGGCAELSWEFTIEALAQRYRVLAPDWLGFGQSAKVFSFDNMWDMRVQHIRKFLELMLVDRAHFIGNSMGGTMLLATAASSAPPWGIASIVAIAGGGQLPDNEARKVLNSYDGSREHMSRIIAAMFVNPRITADEAYISRRHALSREHGAWECTAAARFRAPWHSSSAWSYEPPDYSTISAPVLLVTGTRDQLRHPGFGEALRAQIPGAMLHVVANAGHCPQIEEPDEVNEVILRFLSAREDAGRPSAKVA